MTVFAKIFAQIFDSSISSDYVVRHIFMDLLVLADRDGVVDMTLDAISRRTNVPQDLVAHAIAELMKDDRASRSHEEDGRRLVAIDSHRDWGWQIVNYDHYRNIKDEEARRTYFRDRQREHRAKSNLPRQTLSKHVKDISHQSTKVTQADTEADTDTEVKTKASAKGKPSQFVVPAWINKQTWKDFEEMRQKIRAPLTDRARKGIVDELAKIRDAGGDPEPVLVQSISNAWRGVFPLKTLNGGFHGKQDHLIAILNEPDS